MDRFEERDKRNSGTILNYKKLRNLTQYRDMTDAEFDEMFARKVLGVSPVQEFEGRIERKLKNFEDDYDMSEMKINDKETLRALAQALITLEDLEQYSYKLRGEGIGFDSLSLMEKISKQMSDLRADISKMQDDLKITRKIRKGDKEESVIAYLDDLKEKAKKFYQTRMAYIFCPSCGMLLSTVWTLYPSANNKLKFTCKRELDGGGKCDTEFTVETKDLLTNRMTNRPELLPESML